MGGTEKCMQYFLEYLHNPGYDCYCIHNRKKTDEAGGSREKLIQDILGDRKVLGYSSEDEFFDILKKMGPDIFHIHRSGYPNEFPIIPKLKSYVNKCVETNIFGGVDTSSVIDMTLYVNKHMLKTGRSLNRKIGYLFNPVKHPFHQKDLRLKLGISKSTFVMGRIGRSVDSIFDPISLRALKVIEEETDYDLLYLVQSPPPIMIKIAQEMKLKKIQFLEVPIVTDKEITSFFNTIDILAHARKDGEICPLNIQEAMIHGKPVISHRSRRANGHKLFVKRCGFFARQDNYKQYAKYIKILYTKKTKRMKLGEEGRKYAADNFLLENIGKKLESYYKALLV